MAQLALRNIYKSFGAVPVIKGVDLEIADREFVVFVGPSGCGKSTLLRIIAGLDDQTAGEVVIDGVDVSLQPPARRGIAMVFQSYALYPHLNVMRNMGFGLRQAGAPREEIRAKVADAARILQLEPLLKRKPRELSGGQRQRVAIGRAIVRSPKVFLFDEPLSNLDAALRVGMRVEIARLHREIAATMVYVTHDQVEAMTLADRIVVLNQGQVEQVGSPLELYHNPVNQFVAGFIGAPKMNFLPCPVEMVEAEGVTVGLPGGGRVTVPVDGTGLEAGASLALGIRPEHLQLRPTDRDADSAAVLNGVALIVEHLGGLTDLHLSGVGDALVVVQTPGGVDVQPDDPVTVGVPADACHLFTVEGVALPRFRPWRPAPRR